MKPLLSTAALIILLATSGMAMADDGSHGKGSYGDGSFMNKALAKLPADDAAKFRATVKQSRDKDKDLTNQLRTLHEDLTVIIAADKFDGAAYIAKNQEIMKIHNTLNDHKTAAFAAAISQLTPAERKTLADSLYYGKHEYHGNDKPVGNSAPAAN